MSLNPNAKPFSFNVGAAAFVPGTSFTPAAVPVVSAVPAPAPVTTTSVTTTTTSTSEATPSPVDDVTDGVNDIELDEEDLAELAEAEREDREAAEAAAAAAAATAAAATAAAASDAAASAAAASAAAAPAKITRDAKKFHEIKAHDTREHVNIVFIGHVDAGKSTISGQILLLTGQVDERTIAKYEREAKEKNRESWYLAYVMDTNEEERARGKTVEVGRAHFETEKKRYTLLDAPGHKSLVSNMIGGASQADVGVLVISARKGEFEAGFDRGGQTREHAMLAKTLGLQKLVVLINKMDEKDINWTRERFDQIEGVLSPFIVKCGFKKSDLVFIPASGFTGQNIRDPVSEAVCPWYTLRQSLFQVLDSFPPLSRDISGPVRLPVMARYKEMGTLFIIGKLESGSLVKDTKLLLMPTKTEVQCTGVLIDEKEVDVAKAGENVLVRIKGVEEEDVQIGFVLSYPDRPCKRSSLFEVQIAVLDLLEHKPLLTTGYEAVLHLHMLIVECTITKLVSTIDKKTGERTDKPPRFLRSGDFAIVRIRVPQSISLETFKDCPALGRFTLRDESKTIAIGKVMQIKEDP